MRNQIVIISLLIPSLAFADTPLPKPDRIIASIDNEPITLRDLEDFEKLNGLKTPAEEGSDEFKKLYEEYLVQLLVEKEAKTLGIAVSDEDLEGYISEIKKQNNINDAQLEELLKGKGLNLATYRKQITQEILRTRLTQQHARTHISISDQEIDRKLGVEGEETEAESHLFQVFVPLQEDGAATEYKLSEAPTDDGAEGAKEKRRAIAQQILDKSTSAAELKSAGSTYFSDLGVINPEDLLPELREEVSGLSEDEVSDLIETDRGFYIFSIGSVKEDSSSIPKEAKDKVRKELFDSRLRSEMESFITKELPKKYNLERKL
jgi:parvulin-like peptidyl-prolyl isomerase